MALTTSIYVKFTGIKEIQKYLDNVLSIIKYHEKNLPMMCSLDYVSLVRTKIIQQDFSYPALSVAYQEWKNIHFPSAKTFWHLGGDLVNAIQSIQYSPTKYAGTIPRGLQDSGGKSYARDSTTEILKYALVLEEGLPAMNIAARPLFGPANEEYAAGGYLDRVEEVRKAIISKWGK